MWGGGEAVRGQIWGRGNLKLAGGELPKGGGANVAKFGVFLMQMMQMMQGF